MNQLFQEVFPTFEPTGEMASWLQDVRVTKVSRDSEWTQLKVYITSGHLIPYSGIVKIQEQLQTILRPWRRLNIQLVPYFILSSQYTAESLLEFYGESMEAELKDKSRLDYYLYRRTRFVFPEPGCIMLQIPEDVMKEARAQHVVDFVREILCERCGLDVEIRQEFYVPDPKDDDWRIDPEESIRLQTQQIADQFAKNHNQSVAKAPVQASPATEKKKKEDAPEKPSYRSQYKIDHPDVLYGRDFDEEEIVALSEVTELDTNVCVRGQILDVDEHPTRKGDKIIFGILITDFTDSIKMKLFVKTEEGDEIRSALAKGTFVKVKGSCIYDNFDRELGLSRIYGVKKATDFRVVREDRSPQKRVELHCHTKMSDMDAVSDVKDIIACAKRWGHKAIAITDHGVVQAFPDANHAVSPDEDFKVIYGCEGYLVDDLKDIAQNEKGQTLSDTYVVFDLETTGLSITKNRIIEIGAVKVADGKIVERFSTFVNPEVPIPYEIEQLTSIKDADVIGAPTIAQILPEFMAFCEGAVLVAHNADFDTGFIRENCLRYDLPYDFTVVDTVALSRALLHNLKRFKLNQVAKELKVSLDHHHRAVDDAECTAEIFIKLCERLHAQDVHDLAGMNEVGRMSEEAIRKLRSYHVILLAKNDIGRVNLYRLVSDSHLKYFNRRPLIPKSLLSECREGLIIGSACEAGELYQALLRDTGPEEIARLVEFYDYLEIQPVGNNEFMIRDPKSDIETFDDLREINRRIVKLGEQFRKPVVATCDVHFLNPEDEIYRRIIMAGQKYDDADMQPPLYLHTTEEMLEEFAYLGAEKAFEVVVTNTNRIADMCERISPVRPDKCPPVIEDSDVTLRKICYDKAHEMYGENLPQVVTERLERELNSIISNGFAVMYIIAQKLVWKSNEDGYLVGSRGSVGSSFVATMAGITEVNPLRPHYYCKKCHFSDFDSPEVLAFAGRSGCDMPDRICPECGEPLEKDGFDIPFETFLGFKGNKEPDIDLNFSGEYQSNAHKYTEVIFGTGQTFRAGTIGTLADKTAFGFVKNYYLERGIEKRNSEIDRIVKGCVGVRRTTGQHPGGIIVLPHGESIYSFTPIQHPANDMTTDIITTHFDYHSIDHNLLKLDILGHDDPTMIRMLEDVTGVDAKDIPLTDKQVMSLFSGTQALNVTPEALGCPLGSLGVPEFGTDFVIQMLQDTKPQTFSDLIRISGLSHGTNVWLDNAQTLIKEGKATISTAICTRDDIMTYLIGMGLESELSFTIMEKVRKGKGLTPEYEAEMSAHDVPDWYLESCNKISYMFPKAHAAAYVMMAWRIAWFKIYYPLAYYAAYFSIRATSFDYRLMAMGQDKLKYYMDDFKRRGEAGELTKAEQDTQKDMKNVWEMYVRGFEFMPMDIYRAKANRFQIVDGKLMAAINTVGGLGDKVAEQIEEAAKDGPFLSKEDFRNRTKASKTITDNLVELGILEGLPETNQLSIFDLLAN